MHEQFRRYYDLFGCLAVRDKLNRFTLIVNKWSFRRPTTTLRQFKVAGEQMDSSRLDLKVGICKMCIVWVYRIQYSYFVLI